MIETMQQTAPTHSGYEPALWHVAPESLLISGARVDEQLAKFAPMSLAELNRVALLDRVESKYLLHIDTLPAALQVLRSSYAVLEIDQRRVNHYRTLYFDTPDFALYRRHQAGALNRYKVRSREYIESQLTFLEVKHKTNKKRTVKSRLTTEALVTNLCGAPASFVDTVCPVHAGSLEPRLWNRYTRLTLANLAGQERLTIDMGLTFEWEGRALSLSGIVIVEVKQERARGVSPFVEWAHSRRLRPTAFSKYCVGVSLLYPEMKANRFKAAHRTITKIMLESTHGTF